MTSAASLNHLGECLCARMRPCQPIPVAALSLLSSAAHPDPVGYLVRDVGDLIKQCSRLITVYFQWTFVCVLPGFSDVQADHIEIVFRPRLFRKQQGRNLFRHIFNRAVTDREKVQVALQRIQALLNTFDHGAHLQMTFLSSACRESTRLVESSGKPVR